MSIWDDVAKKMTDAASYTAKKTGELTSLAKMKYALHSEESKLSECFEEIGKLYYAYQRNGEDLTTEIAALIAEADVIKANIAEMKAEIAKAKNQATCKSCGAEMDATMSFCPSCGAKQAENEPEAEPAEDITEE